jgi:hypothetical protein
VRVVPLPDRPPLGVLADAVITRDVRAAIPDFKLVSRDLDARLGGLPAARVVYSGQVRGTPLTWSHTVARDGDTGYMLVCAVGSEDYEPVRPTFERMARSLQVRPGLATRP